MKKVTELTRAINPVTVANQISIIYIPDYRHSLRDMMDGYFLHCSRNGGDPAPAWCAYKAVDAMLENIQVENQTAKTAIRHSY